MEITNNDYNTVGFKINDDISLSLNMEDFHKALFEYLKTEQKEFPMDSIVTGIFEELIKNDCNGTVKEFGRALLEEKDIRSEEISEEQWDELEEGSEKIKSKLLISDSTDDFGIKIKSFYDMHGRGSIIEMQLLDDTH